MSLQLSNRQLWMKKPKKDDLLRAASDRYCGITPGARACSSDWFQPIGIMGTVFLNRNTLDIP